MTDVDAERGRRPTPPPTPWTPRTRPQPTAEAELDTEGSTLSSRASAAGSAIASAASTAGEQVRTVVHSAGELALQARQAIGDRAQQIALALAERPGRRVRRVRRMAKQPLPVLWDCYPEARNAPMREAGLVEVPTEKIIGTAQEVGDRGGDFLPLKAFRGDNWSQRWQRILRGIDQLKSLPPVDLLRVGDQYWVVDGHNRVAAALYNGQLTVDANVVDIRLPGSPRPAGPPAPIAAYLGPEMLALRAAGEGRPRLAREAWTTPCFPWETTTHIHRLRPATTGRTGDDAPAARRLAARFRPRPAWPRRPHPGCFR